MDVRSRGNALLRVKVTSDIILRSFFLFYNKSEKKLMKVLGAKNKSKESKVEYASVLERKLKWSNIHSLGARGCHTRRTGDSMSCFPP